MEQDSFLKDGRHSPSQCHYLQGQAQNPEQVGEQGVCGGMAALSKFTSICGTSHRWGKVQLYPIPKLPVVYQQ